MIQIELIASPEAMTALAARWTALWRRQPGATPFQHPAWLEAWWRQFGNEWPRLVTAWSGADLVGILPLYEYEDVDGRKLLPVGIGLSDYIDALCDPAHPEAVDPILAAIGDIPEWRECYLPDLAPEAALRRAACPPGVSDEFSDSIPCPVLALPGCAEGLAQIVPRKTLRDLRQAHSRTKAAGSLAFEAADDARSVEAAMGELFRLHRKRWRERGEGGVLGDAKVQAFHREAAPVLLECGLLRLYTLRIGGGMVAVYYGFVHGGRAYAYLGGFDPDEPRLSPGAQIIGHAITEAIAEGAREFDFLRGGETYKYAWGAADRWSAARRILRR